MTDLRKAAEKPWVKTYCGGKPNYCTPEVTPDVDAVSTSQEPVDETAKREHEPLVWMNKYGHVASFQNEEYKDPLDTAPPKREWVGLTDEEVNDCIKSPNRNLFARDGTTSQRIARAIEAKLKEKNT